MSTFISNYTSLIEDIENLTIQGPSTTDMPFPSPADPFEDYVNVTDHGVVDTIGNNNNNGTDSGPLLRIIAANPWIIYAVCAVAGLIVIVGIVVTILWLKKNKTRVINETTDPVLTSNYQDDSGFMSCCCPCFRGKSGLEHRQNSASNLEFYGRPALPQAVYQTERPKSQESYILEPSNLAVYIDEIEEIPNREPPNGQSRNLPRLDYQKYQKYHAN